VSADERGHGLGRHLMELTAERAQKAGIDGLLTVATDDEQFLHARALEGLGFKEVDRADGRILLELAFTEQPSQARLRSTVRAEGSDRPRVRIRHAYHCPLLLSARAALKHAAQGAMLDETDASADDPSGAWIDGEPLVHGYIPAAALLANLRSRG
jgi:hypothetical protein